MAPQNPERIFPILGTNFKPLEAIYFDIALTIVSHYHNSHSWRSPDAERPFYTIKLNNAFRNNTKSPTREQTRYIVAESLVTGPTSSRPTLAVTVRDRRRSPPVYLLENRRL